MAEGLSRLWLNFSLSKEESVGVKVVDQCMIGIADRGRSCVVGKLIADRVIGKDAIKATLTKGWKPVGTIRFKVLGENLFLV